MRLKFPFKEERSRIFRSIKRPMILVNFWSKKYQRFLQYSMIVDTGADYTLFPRHVALDLGINLEKDCQKYSTRGIGGEEKVFLYRRAKMNLGNWERTIPVGFLNRDDIPPLLGRQSCLERFDLLLSKFTTYIDEAGKIKSQS